VDIVTVAVASLHIMAAQKTICPNLFLVISGLERQQLTAKRFMKVLIFQYLLEESFLQFFQENAVSSFQKFMFMFHKTYLKGMVMKLC
jgi:hypothetical protein